MREESSSLTISRQGFLLSPWKGDLLLLLSVWLLETCTCRWSIKWRVWKITFQSHPHRGHKLIEVGEHKTAYDNNLNQERSHSDEPLATDTTRSPFHCNQLPGWQVIHPQIVTLARSMFLYFFHHLQRRSSAGSPGWHAASPLREEGYGSSGGIGCLTIWSFPQTCGAHQSPETLGSCCSPWTDGTRLGPFLAQAHSTAGATTASTGPQRQDPAARSRCSWAMLTHESCWHSKAGGLVHLMTYSRLLSQKHRGWKK